jgi:hypothetical protein
MHSTASDGAFGPAEVVEHARALGLRAIALTDHDTVNGLAAARATGDRVGVEVIAGIELSAIEHDAEIHLLGLHLARLDLMEARLSQLRAGRVARAERIVDVLNTLGVPVTMGAVLAQSGAGAVGRPHVARALMAGTWVRDIREAFDRYLGAGRPAFVAKEEFAVADAIALVHAAGGLAVLAHPGGLAGRDQIADAVDRGLDGVEVKHPSHDLGAMARLLALTDAFDLVPSGGSDWHGALTGSRVMGAMRVPEQWLDRQYSRLADRSRGACLA